jgi:hypothetical protein
MREKHSSWNGSCLEWLPAKHDGGYGLVWIDSRIWRVTVVVWTLEVGPPKNDVLHKCHNPMCFLFDHLYDGTESQNGLDMVRAGRVKNQYDIPSYDVVSRYGLCTQQANIHSVHWLRCLGLVSKLCGVT